MKPTPKLRFVERDGPMMGFQRNPDGSDTTMHQKIRILQQWWEDDQWDGPDDWGLPGEWRDVPIEKESE